MRQNNYKVILKKSYLIKMRLMNYKLIMFKLNN